MRRLILTCGSTLLFASASHAAPSAAMCSALQRIDATSRDGFDSIPKIKRDHSGWSVQPVIPGGSDGHVDPAMGGLMMFSVQFKDTFRSAKQAVVECLPGSKVMGVDSSNDPIAPQIDYVTLSQMQVTIASTEGGIKSFTFSAKALMK
jgi:hypothetical protein